MLASTAPDRRILWVSLLVLLPHPGGADVLRLRGGKSLRIEAIACAPDSCRVRFAGGEAEIPAAAVLGVEPQEEVDAEPASEIEGNAADPSRVPARALDEIIADAARAYALPRSLVRAVARAESAFDAGAVSPKGAQGVMQLMPGTSQALGVRDPFDPEENIRAGARLLRQLLEKYQGRVVEALAAYNAGEGAVARHRGVPPYAETRGYVRRVVREFERAGGAGANPAAEPRER